MQRTDQSNDRNDSSEEEDKKLSEALPYINLAPTLWKGLTGCWAFISLLFDT